MFKTNYILVSLCILFSACGQKIKNNTIEDKISANNIVEKIASQVKHYQQEPMYFLRVNKINCVYEVLINGFPVDKMYELGGWMTPIEINHAILKSGSQTVTYRLYPLGDLLKKQRGVTINQLLDKTSIEIKIFRVEDHRTYDSEEDEKTVILHKSLTKKDGTFVGSGKPYYEYTFTFNAEVPYENEGWSNGVNLRKLDQSLLEHKVLNYYNELKKKYEKRDLNNILEIHYDHVLKNAVAEYQSKDKISKVIGEIVENVKREGNKFFEIENYKMEYYGDGKLVALKHKNDSDSYYRGESAFYFDYPKDGNLLTYFLNVYLYIPKNTDTKGIHLQMMK